MSGRLKKLKVRISGFRLADMLKFKNLPLRRDKAIEAAEDREIVTDFPINSNARMLHPDCQKMVVSRIVDHATAGARTIELRKEDGSPAAWFRSGQYISVKMRIGDSVVTRPYSISSSPNLTRDGIVQITVKRSPGAFVSDYLLDEIKVGDPVLISGPEGQFYHERLRDCENVVAVAGGSGITPFLSMACSIRDGIEDFCLTILMGSRTEDTILFRNELDEIARESDKVRVIHVLSDEKKSGFEHGFITADLIGKYAPEGDYSLFICGPEGLYRFLSEELEKLDIPGRRIRREILAVSGDVTTGPDYPKQCREKTYNVRIIQGPQEFSISARAEESVLVAMERAGITAPSRCRSGECGWCRSKIISGTVFIPQENDSRRHMDRQTGHIHPCVSFPISDLVIEVPRGDIPTD